MVANNPRWWLLLGLRTIWPWGGQKQMQLRNKRVHVPPREPGTRTRIRSISYVYRLVFD